MLFTIKTLNQFFQSIADQAISLLLAKEKQIGNLIEVAGVIGEIKTDDTKYSIAYGIVLKDNSEYVLLDVPKSLLKERSIHSGQFVRVHGSIKGVISEYTKHKLEMRLDVSDIVAATSPAESEKHRQNYEDITKLLKLNAGRHAFPLKERPTIAVITGKSSKVEDDFMHAIAPVKDFFEIHTSRINITDKIAISSSIENSKADILALIRGGGGEIEFEVFNDSMVLTALSKFNGYRIVGLGHSSNGTLCDLIADFSGETPGQAGIEIRDKYESFTKVLKLVSVRDREIDRLKNELRLIQPKPEWLNEKPKTKKNAVFVNLVITIFLFAIIYWLLTQKF